MSVQDEIREKETSLYRWRSTSYGGTLARGIIFTVLGGSFLTYCSIWLMAFYHEYNQYGSWARSLIWEGSKSDVIARWIVLVLGIIFLPIGISGLKSFASSNSLKNQVIQTLQSEIYALQNKATQPAARSATRLTAGSIEELPGGKWRCSCGRVNEAYTGTCACGVNKALVKAKQMKAEKEKKEKEAEAYRKEQQEAANQKLIQEATQRKQNQAANFAALRELKGLLDDGIITQDEFDRKKKIYLGDADEPEAAPAVAQKTLSLDSSDLESANVKFCPVCGTRQRPDAKFCASCGHRF